jgi:hypothetical protein
MFYFLSFFEYDVVLTVTHYKTPIFSAFNFRSCVVLNAPESFACLPYDLTLSLSSL